MRTVQLTRREALLLAVWLPIGQQKGIEKGVPTELKKGISSKPSGAKIDGIWVFDAKAPDGSLTSQIVTIEEKGGQLRVTDPENSVSWAGITKGDDVTFPIMFKAKGGGTSTTAKVNFGGKWQGDTISGKVIDAEISVSGTRLPSVWQCGHTNPSHIAISELEMRQLTDKYQCKGWHKLNLK